MVLKFRFFFGLGSCRLGVNLPNLKFIQSYANCINFGLPEMPFKTPDGKEFKTKSEWRDYMVQTFYTFKNKVNEVDPCVKKPGDIAGQMFDICDCENSTLVVMDHTEQVQIDVLKNCRVFIAACASSIFIRNCEGCTFYICCRQLCLRDCKNCFLYSLSMSEIHIELSSGLKCAPFSGGYPEHAEHLKSAGLDPNHNLWYDVFDHNDPAKSHANWSLVDPSAYEEPWFPVGACEPAVPYTHIGSVKKIEYDDMQSFSFDQLVKDATALTPPTSVPPIPNPTAIIPTVNRLSLSQPDQSDDNSYIKSVLNLLINNMYEPLSSTLVRFTLLHSFVDKSHSVVVYVQANEGTRVVGPLGVPLERTASPTSVIISELWNIENISVSTSGDLAWAALWVHQTEVVEGREVPTESWLTLTVVLEKKAVGSSESEKCWKVARAQSSSSVSADAVKVPRNL